MPLLLKTITVGLAILLPLPFALAIASPYVPGISDFHHPRYPNTTTTSAAISHTPKSSRTIKGPRETLSVESFLTPSLMQNPDSSSSNVQETRTSTFSNPDLTETATVTVTVTVEGPDSEEMGALGREVDEL